MLPLNRHNNGRARLGGAANGDTVLIFRQVFNVTRRLRTGRDGHGRRLHVDKEIGAIKLVHGAIGRGDDDSRGQIAIRGEAVTLERNLPCAIRADRRFLRLIAQGHRHGRARLTRAGNGRRRIGGVRGQGGAGIRTVDGGHDRIDLPAIAARCRIGPTATKAQQTQSGQTGPCRAKPAKAQHHRRKHRHTRGIIRPGRGQQLIAAQEGKLVVRAPFANGLGLCVIGINHAIAAVFQRYRGQLAIGGNVKLGLRVEIARKGDGAAIHQHDLKVVAVAHIFENACLSQVQRDFVAHADLNEIACAVTCHKPTRHAARKIPDGKVYRLYHFTAPPRLPSALLAECATAISLGITVISQRLETLQPLW